MVRGPKARAALRAAAARELVGGREWKDGEEETQLTVEIAKSGRAACRHSACGRLIPAKSLRIGRHRRNFDDERASTFERTQWFHLRCAFSQDFAASLTPSLRGVSRLAKNRKEEVLAAIASKGASAPTTDTLPMAPPPPEAQRSQLYPSPGVFKIVTVDDKTTPLFVFMQRDGEDGKEFFAIQRNGHVVCTLTMKASEGKKRKNTYFKSGSEAARKFMDGMVRKMLKQGYTTAKRPFWLDRFE
mmetsp:Transcript_34636/g.81001  ORF Transcript_34636/g.81001 Transcript_34636/m.81001 type:complete len:244 (+) Transcript_34636:3-734(+)